MRFVRSGTRVYNLDHVVSLQLVGIQTGEWFVNVHMRQHFIAHYWGIDKAVATTKLQVLARDFLEAGLRLVRCEDAYYAPAEVYAVSYLVPPAPGEPMIYVLTSVGHYTHKGTPAQLSLAFDDFVDKLRHA